MLNTRSRNHSIKKNEQEEKMLLNLHKKWTNGLTLRRFGFYMVLKSCEGGELFDQITRKGLLSEDEPRFYSAEVVDALGSFGSTTNSC